MEKAPELIVKNEAGLSEKFLTKVGRGIDWVVNSQVGNIRQKVRTFVAIGVTSGIAATGHYREALIFVIGIMTAGNIIDAYIPIKNNRPPAPK